MLIIFIASILCYVLAFMNGAKSNQYDRRNMNGMAFVSSFYSMAWCVTGVALGLISLLIG